MDSLISAAARALAGGDPLGALQRVALRGDPPALALRGIAMAQLGEHVRARALLQSAARSFGPQEALARARCVVAEAEVALAQRDFAGPAAPLRAAVTVLQAHGDHGNALHARLIEARQLLLLGRLDEAGSTLAALPPVPLPPPLSAVAELVKAELALRALRTEAARSALARAMRAARRARVPALLAEVRDTCAALRRPAARRLAGTDDQPLRLHEVEALLGSGTLVVDACRRGLGTGTAWQPLGRRPVLFALARLLAQAWPGDVERHALIATVFRTRRPDETHRARLRVEIGRLRALVQPWATVQATPRGYALRPHGAAGVAVLVPPIDGEPASLVALLSDGAAWSTSSLALALGASQRTVQRALAQLQAAGQVRAIGRGPARRWLAPPLVGFTTVLLLPPSLPPA